MDLKEVEDDCTLEEVEICQPRETRGTFHRNHLMEKFIIENKMCLVKQSIFD